MIRSLRVMLAAVVLIVAFVAVLVLFAMAASLGFAIFVSIPIVLTVVPPLLGGAFELAGSLVRPTSRSATLSRERREPVIVAHPPAPRTLAA